MDAIPELPASGPAAAMLPSQQLHLLSPGNAMLLSSGRKVDVASRLINVPLSFLHTCFSPPIISSTQATAHVVIRTQDVTRLPPDAAPAAGYAGTHSQSAENHFLQLHTFECNVYNPGGHTPALRGFAHSLDAFQSWRIYKLEAVSFAHAVPS